MKMKNDMKKRIHRAFKTNEIYVFLTIIAVTLIIEVISGQFYTPNNLVDIVRSFIPSALFSIGLMVVLISGGIDLSFPAVAALSGYLVILIQTETGGGLIDGYLMAIVFGILFGAVNGFLVSRFKFEPMIVTLGTANVYRGFLQGALRCRELFLTDSVLAFGKGSLFTVVSKDSDMQATMPYTVLFVLALGLLTYFILQKTMLGRGIYAIGGDQQSAVRAGFNVPLIQMFVYCFAGATAAFAGYTKFIMNLYCVPTSLIGIEHDIIAGVVLGGVRITGGVGTVRGAFLGILLLTIVKNSLLLLNVSTSWQTMVTAIFIIAGTSITALQLIISRKKHAAVGE